MAERFASVSEDELWEKCIIKQLLNSVFAWYHELSNPRVCVIRLSLRQITQTSALIIHDIMLNLIQQLFIVLQIIMEGVIGSSYHSDIAVDDIYLSKGTCCQLKHRAFDIASVGELKFVYAGWKEKNRSSSPWRWSSSPVNLPVPCSSQRASKTKSK